MGQKRTRTPAVSICIPAYNAEKTIVETLDSAWSQTFEDFEVVVVDDHSGDRTRDLVAEVSDPRLRLQSHRRNVGVSMTTNHAISLARGRFIKFLDNDDLLGPMALERLHEALSRDSGVTIAFCRREAFLDEESDVDGERWLGRYTSLCDRFAELRPVNSGRQLLREWLGAGASGNWIGEPVCVMARRDAILRAGGQNPRIRQINDVGLWTKLLALGDAAFVDAELVRYRIRRESLTRTNTVDNRGWLDLAWVLSDLWGLEDLRASEPLLKVARREKLVFVLKESLRLLGSPGSQQRLREMRPLIRAVAGART